MRGHLTCRRTAIGEQVHQRRLLREGVRPTARSGLTLSLLLTHAVREAANDDTRLKTPTYEVVIAALAPALVLVGSDLLRVVRASDCEGRASKRLPNPQMNEVLRIVCTALKKTPHIIENAPRSSRGACSNNLGEFIGVFLPLRVNGNIPRSPSRVIATSVAGEGAQCKAALWRIRMR